VQGRIGSRTRSRVRTLSPGCRSITLSLLGSRSKTRRLIQHTCSKALLISGIGYLQDFPKACSKIVLWLEFGGLWCAIRISIYGSNSKQLLLSVHIINLVFHKFGMLEGKFHSFYWPRNRVFVKESEHSFCQFMCSY